MKWIYKDDFYEASDNDYGFVYKITYEYDDKEFYYFGQKQIVSIVEIGALKNGLPRQYHKEFVNRNRNGKRVKREVLVKPVKYHSYNGSCKDERIKDMIMVSKEVIRVVPYGDNAKLNLTYAELELLVKEDVLRRDDCLNANLLGKFYKDRII